MIPLKIISEDAAPAAAHQRRSGRHRVMLSARLLSPAGLSNVVLLDLSNHGAMISAPLPLPKGSHVVLTRGRLEAHATIMWVEGRRLGLQFDAPLAHEILDEAVFAVARVAH